jgi:hypothetical protein
VEEYMQNIRLLLQVEVKIDEGPFNSTQLNELKGELASRLEIDFAYLMDAEEREEEGWSLEGPSVGSVEILSIENMETVKDLGNEGPVALNMQGLLENDERAKKRAQEKKT